MIELRRKILIPVFQLTETCASSDPAGVKRVIQQGKGVEPFTYFSRAVSIQDGEDSINYNLFPIPLDRSSKPWSFAVNYLLSRLEGDSSPNMASYISLADDLGAFKEWLDKDANPTELLFCFPRMKLRRCTYRYSGYLRQQISSGEVAPSTAKRRMSTVIAFYRWLMEEGVFKPENNPWEERDYSITLKSEYGAVYVKKGVTTKLSIKTSGSEDALDDTIQDGGKLRPLSTEEQRWVMAGLNALGNPEMYLLCLFMVTTGARIQTATTLRVRHFTTQKPTFFAAISGGGAVFRLRCGPGTGIDTKGGKSDFLQIPLPLFNALRTYAVSDRAVRRRTGAVGGDNNDQYLFLTQQGSPYYQSKDDTSRFDPDYSARYRKAGGTIRQFLTNRLIPYIKKNHDPKFHFRIHDLRATFGMNHTDLQMDLVESGKVSLSQARNIVRKLMWHKNSSTTDLYLSYRRRLEQMHVAINGYGEQVQQWIDQAMSGVSYDNKELR